MSARAVAALWSALAVALLLPGMSQPAVAASPNCGGSPDVVLAGGGQVRVFAMQHKEDLADDATYQSIHDALECELTSKVDPYRAADHPNVVVFNELTGLSYGTEGVRGAVARGGSSQATLVEQLVGVQGGAGIGTVAAGYAPQIALYIAALGAPAPGDVPATVDLLFTAVTDTMVRAVVENVSALAREHGVYIVFGAPLVAHEGAACAGQFAGWAACPGWHRSTDPADIARYADPVVAPTYAYVADTKNVDNVALFFGPDGALYDMQPKVNLTGIEIGTLGWHQANASTIHAIGLRGGDTIRFPGVKFGVGISLDAFETATSATPCPAEPDPGAKADPYPQFMQCLDSKGVNVFLQPEFNDGGQACMSWTDFTEDCGGRPSWQPLSWMRSAWGAVQARAPGGGFQFPHIQYAVNPFMVGNLFSISGDGQSAIFARDDPRAHPGWYAGDSSAALYNGAGVGVYTDRADDPRYRRYEGPQPGFLALARWVIPESVPAAQFRCKPVAAMPDCVAGKNVLAPGDAGSLQSCEKGLAPGSNVTSGLCAENQYRATALVADLFPAAAASAPTPPSPTALPLTSATSLPALPLSALGVLVALALAAGAVALARRPA